MNQRRFRNVAIIAMGDLSKVGVPRKEEAQKVKGRVEVGVKKMTNSNQ